MSNLIEKNFETILFHIKSYECDCAEDVVYTVPGKSPTITFKAQALASSPIVFSYVSKEGLCRTGPNGAIHETNILGKMLGLAELSPKAYREFFTRCGFLFPISQEEYDIIDLSNVQKLILRLKYAVDLKAAIESIRKDYSKISSLIITLLHAAPITIKTTMMSHEYKTYEHPFNQFIQTPPLLSRQRQIEATQGNFFLINDPIIQGFRLPVDTFHSINDGSILPSDPYFKNATLMLLNRKINDDNQFIASFLFHLNYDQLNGPAPLSDKMQQAALQVAKIILSHEINYNIRNIKMYVDPLTLHPTWQIDSLYCAAYFSIFYTSDSVEIMRQCQNPRCKNYFTVKATTTTKKYCCEECRNRVMQSEYRRRKRIKAEN